MCKQKKYIYNRVFFSLIGYKLEGIHFQGPLNIFVRKNLRRVLLIKGTKRGGGEEMSPVVHIKIYLKNLIIFIC